MTARRPLPPELRSAYCGLCRKDPESAQAWALRWCTDPEAVLDELRALQPREATSL